MTELSIADRKQLARDAILSAKPKVEPIHIFGTDVEIRQIPLSGVLEYEQSEDRKRAAIEMLIRYTVLPGTTIPLFDEADVDSLANLPFGEDMNRWQQAINKLTGVAELVENELKNSTTA
jgi:hypothetical protein